MTRGEWERCEDWIGGGENDEELAMSRWYGGETESRLWRGERECLWAEEPECEEGEGCCLE